MKLKVLTFSIFLFSFFLFSCKEYQEIKVSNIDNFRMKKLDMTGLEAEIDVTIDNPNAIAFKIFKSRCDVIYGGVKLGEARLARSIRIPGKSNKTHTFVLKGNFKDMALTDITKIISGKSGKLELNGTIKAGKLFYRKKYPLDKKQLVNMKSLF